MKVGGLFRGYNRAVRISGQYSINCFFIGAAAIVLVAPFSGRDFVGVAAGFIFYHFWIAAVMFLTSLPANMLLVRFYRGRTWRNERWRARIAGGLGIVFTAVGIGLGAMMPPPPLLTQLTGGFGWFLHFMGWFILWSNLALLVAWALPSRKG